MKIIKDDEEHFIYPEVITVEVVRCVDCSFAIEHDDTHIACYHLHCLKKKDGYCDEASPKIRRKPFVAPNYDEEEN